MVNQRQKPWRDSHGKTLQDYPRPSVAVDTAVLTVKGLSDSSAPTLCVLLTDCRDAGGEATWGLPGTFLHAGERLADAVLRSLREKAGIQGLSPEQLRVFDEPERDPRGWVLSVGHMDVVPERALAKAISKQERVRLVSVDKVLGKHAQMPFDHDVIVREAVDRLRREYERAPDPRQLLRGPFTLRQLEALHREIDPETERKDTFRRRVVGDLKETATFSSGSVGKPARYFRRR